MRRGIGFILGNCEEVVVASAQAGHSAHLNTKLTLSAGGTLKIRGCAREERNSRYAREVARVKKKRRSSPQGCAKRQIKIHRETILTTRLLKSQRVCSISASSRRNGSPRRQVSAREEFFKVAKLRGLRNLRARTSARSVKKLASRSKVTINFQPPQGGRGGSPSARYGA